jgi:hypothetical protein
MQDSVERFAFQTANYIKKTCNAKTGALLALWYCDAQSMQKPPAGRTAGGKLV